VDNGLPLAPDTPMTGTPGDDDSLGVWAFADRAPAAAKAAAEAPVRRYARRRVGRGPPVGELIEQELGYRAEAARIVAIEGVAGRFGLSRRGLLRRLRARYAVGSFRDYERECVGGGDERGLVRDLLAPGAQGAVARLATIQLPSGMRTHDMPILTGREGLCAALPAVPQLDRDGFQRRDADGGPAYRRGLAPRMTERPPLSARKSAVPRPA
jgi:hypothetical protein